MLKSYEELKEFESEYKLIPVFKEVFSDSITPITLLRKIAKENTRYYLLESLENEEQWGRYSFIGYDPIKQVYCKNGLIKVIKIKENEIKEIETNDPMEVLREIQARYKSPLLEDMPPFTGGMVGYFAYEMVDYFYKNLNLERSEFKDYDFMVFDKVIVFDHLKQKIMVIGNYKAKVGEESYNNTLHEIDEIIGFIEEDLHLPNEKTGAKVEFEANFSEEDFCEQVDIAKEYISSDEIEQVVISRKYTAEYNESLLNTYRVLRTTNPSPYMYYMKIDDVEIAGASPETLIKLQDKELRTFPIAGTKPRGRNKEEDEQLMKELLSDKKELKEHEMLVELAKKDLSAIGKEESIKLERSQVIHKFSKVMHLVSEVSANIKDDKDALDAVKALLPAGTLSGSPKERALEIINEIEGEPRGIYGGAIGYIDFSGNMDVCIAIRTAVKAKNKVYIQAGSGIVSESVGETEYKESVNKASAIIDAMEKAGEV